MPPSAPGQVASNVPEPPADTLEPRGISFAVAASRIVRDNISTESFSFAMTQSTSATPVSATNTSAGHLSVHVEGDHPVEVPFLFEQQQKRIAPAAVASFVYHAL